MFLRTCIQLSADKKLNQRGLTLVELLAAVVVVGLLASMGSMAVGRVRNSTAQAEEIAAARRMTAAYLTYATHHDAELMRAYQFGARVDDPNGDVRSGPEAERYPWRLAPYLDWDVERALWVNKARSAVLGKEPGSWAYRYAVSLGPELGINAYCVGGYESASGLNNLLLPISMGLLSLA